MSGKNQYLRQVKKALPTPHAKKEEILRDLQEVFASAAEHGKTEQDVIRRLGTPEEFARGFESHSAPKQNAVGFGNLRLIWGLAIFSAILLGTAIAAYALRTPPNVIGQADAMTGIVLRSDTFLDPLVLLFLLGAAAGIVAATLIVRRLLVKRRYGRK